jgi:methylisocitrate lyase
MPHETRHRRLRRLIADQTLQIPGAFNALVARAIEKSGFPAVYVSGAGLSNAVFGLPDVGLFTLTEAVDHAAKIVRATTLPVIVDGDTGFGDAINAARTISEMEAAGVSAVHLEDQVLPKKCGHLDGKALVSADAMAQKIKAAVAARTDPDFMIIARTDARGVTSFDDAVDRARRYLDAGADAIFPEAMKSREELAAFADKIEAPLLANMTEFGKTPILNVRELGEIGYRLVIYPQTALRVAFAPIAQMLSDLRANGDQAKWIDRMQTRSELYELLDYDGLSRIDEAATK